MSDVLLTWLNERAKSLHILWCVHIFDRNVGSFHVNFVLNGEYWRLHLWVRVFFFIVDCFRITYSDLTRKNNNNIRGFI